MFDKKELKSFVFPGNIESEILDIGAMQLPYMRTSWFSSLVLECERLLLELLDCKQGKVISYTASGSAAMESCITNFVSTQNKVLVINGGTFGKRWADLCRFYEIDFDEIAVEFGEEPNYCEIELKLSSRKYDALLMQHHETSSGVLFDINLIGKICRQNETYLVADVISSFLSDALSMESDNIDVAVISSQKGLDLPPGLSFVALSERVSSLSFNKRSFYLDWKESLSNLKRGQTPYSPATQLYMQLYKRLRLLKSIGVDAQIKKVELKAKAFREKIIGEVEFSASRMSNCITGIYLPFDVEELVKELLEDNIYVMPSGDTKMIRIAHLGNLDINEQIMLANTILEWKRRKR